jgi:tetraprenyl-beta-curcumene synthase
MGPTAWGRARLAAAFFGAACRYWLTVFPCAWREVRRLHERATEIPDPILRRIAIETLREERGNLEGAAAFAVLAPLRRRRRVARATIAFQAVYDYVDSLGEQPGDGCVTNGRRLHEALHAALLSPSDPHRDHYRHHSRSGDGGYLRALIDDCRAALAALPSCELVRRRALRASARIIEYQARVHTGDPADLTAWGEASTPPGSGLAWWEAAAAGASSVGVFALIAAAAHPGLAAADAAAVERAYFPWVGALHVLLDSLVDSTADASAGRLSLVSRYASAGDAATGMAAIAADALAAVRALREGDVHVLILAAMSAFYLTTPGAQDAGAAPARDRILATLGDAARPTLAVLKARRALGRACQRLCESLTINRK